MKGKIPRWEWERLLEDLNYMNLEEMRGFCRRHAIPFAIHVVSPEGKRKRSRDLDRKSIVLERVRRFLETGEMGEPTTFAAAVCSEAPVPSKLKASDRLYYGWYDKKNEDLIGLLRRLTDDRYRNGAVARILMREFWTSGVAPTFAEFAEAWIEAEKKGLGVDRGDHPEAAWLTDRARGEAGEDWKAKRTERARRALEVLERYWG